MHYKVKVIISAVSFFMDTIKSEIFETLQGQRQYRNAAENIFVYTDYLIEKNLPPLIDVGYLAKFSEVPLNILCSAIANPYGFYRTFEIPKQRGGKRLVEAPIPSLLLCQRWIVKNLLEQIEIHSCATAYKKGIGLIENVKPHAGQNHLLKIDLKDFFHSIPICRIISVFQNLGYLHKMSYELASLCCLKGRLPQGAATSPILSNIIAKRLDLRLSAIAAKHNLEYTRYSDDITFSGNNIPVSLISLFEYIISDEGFCINREKTRLYTKQGKRIVTGVSVREKELKLPRNTKRQIRQDFFELIKKTDSKNFFENLHEDVFFLESLKGRLAFWLYLEPDAEYPRLSLEKLQKIKFFQ